MCTRFVTRFYRYMRWHFKAVSKIIFCIFKVTICLGGRGEGYVTVHPLSLPPPPIPSSLKGLAYGPVYNFRNLVNLLSV